MSSRVDDDQLFKKYKTIWSKNEDLKNIWLDSLPVYDDGYIKNKTRTYGDNFQTIFCSLNVPGDVAEYESFTVVSIDSLLVYENKYCLQVYLDNSAYELQTGK